jgi:hypothetical protein
MEGIIKELQRLAAQQTWQDKKDTGVKDFAIGTPDGLFAGGYASGQIDLARRLLVMLETSSS